MEEFKKQAKANLISVAFVFIAIINVWNPIIAIISLLLAYFLFEKVE